jgi:PIN domain nuclease of toxin-antitoxin system
LYDELGATRVAAALTGAVLSTVDLPEVLGRFARDGVPLETALRRLTALPVVFVPFSPEHAVVAARLLPLTRSAGLSFADRACLALALERQATALTTDAAWLRVPHGAAVELLR